MKTFLFVLLGALLFCAVMWFAVTHYPDGTGRWVGFVIGLALFLVCVLGPGRLWGKSNRVNSFALPLVLLIGLPATTGITLFVAVFFMLLLQVRTQEYGGSDYEKPKWYNHPRFSLVPRLLIRPSDEHNTGNFCFEWLFVRLWSLDHAAFELSVAADTHWGIGVLGIVPYLRWTCCIPCPDKAGMWVSDRLRRRPKSENASSAHLSAA